MPTPRAGESHSDWMSRCIPVLINEGRDDSQAAAICQSLWDSKKTTDMGPIIYKDIPAEIKDVDVKKGIVEGYFSTWDIVDAHGDEIVRGAYKKSLLENGPGANRQRIHHLWQHNASTPLYRFTEQGTLLEDNMGLFFRSKPSKTTYGRDVLLLYEDGVINEHSVGIQVVKSENSNEGHMRLLELKLWEGSTVTWGANFDTPVTAMKDLTPLQQAEKFAERIDLLTKSLHEGSYSDDTFILLELQLKQIQGHYMSLISNVQPGDLTGKHDEPNNRVSLDNLLNDLKI